MDIPVQTSGFSAQRPDAKAIAWLSDSAPVVDTLYFISQQDEMAGQALTHVWFLNDQQVGRVDFTPSSNHFRSVSQRQLNAVAAGRWTVRVITAQGKVLDEQTILISP
jgi:hypothetical protein